MARRRVSDYQRFLEGKRDRPAPIPYCTWRRWLQQGKITTRELLEMGIDPGRTRKKGGGRKKKEVPNGNGGGCPVRTASSESGFVDQPDDIEPPQGRSTSSTSGVNEDEGNSTDNALNTTSSTTDGSDLDLEDGERGWLGADDSNSSALSDLDNGEDVSDESDSDSDTARVSSVLDSKNIGRDALNAPFFEGSRLSKFEVMLMIFHLTLRHGCTDTLLEDLISYTNEIAGFPNAIPGSKFLFQKLFKFGSEPTVHFFCPPCQKYLGPKSEFQQFVVCHNCDWSKTCKSLNDGNYFLTLRMRDQLKEVLSKPGLKFVTKELPNESLSDISHGHIYRKLREAGLSHPDALTITMSTDGSPVFKNGSNSLYPIHFHLNEIVPENRFNVQNMLLAGLWFSKTGEPNLQIFFKPIVAELLQLQTQGILWRKPNGETVRSPVYLTCVCADSVARPKVQNFMQFNSQYGCSYCMHPNTSIEVTEPLKRNHGIVGAVAESDLSSDSDTEQDQRNIQLSKTSKIKRYLAGTQYPLRTDSGMRLHMEMVDSLNVEHFYGVKGKSVLSPLTSFNSVFGYAIDYMHAIHLGVTKRLASLWFDSKNSTESYYIGLQVETINRRLAQICPPSNLPRPKSMSLRANWKAKEWGSFLLYYGLPCLAGILPEKYYNHFKLLSTGIFIYSKESTGFDEATEAEQLLSSFVVEYQELYGEKNMVFNVHLVGHLGRQVASLGPLWNYGLYHFEGANGRLVKLVKGTTGAVTQIARKYLMSHSVSKLLRGGMYSVQDSVLKFCSKVIEYKYSKNSRTFEDIRLSGTPSIVKLQEDQRQLLLDSGCNIREMSKVYNKTYYRRTCFSSRSLRRQKVSNDSCVRLQDGAFVIINLIIAADDPPEVWCLGTEINIATDAPLQMPPHIKECAIDAFGCLIAFPFRKIKERCIYMAFDDKHYVAQIPNSFEKS